MPGSEGGRAEKDQPQAGTSPPGRPYIPVLPVLLDKISLRGAIVTADAMHAQREHARYLVDQRGAHYILTVEHGAHCSRLLAGCVK
jgi:hypothetical protein